MVTSSTLDLADETEAISGALMQQVRLKEVHVDLCLIWNGGWMDLRGDKGSGVTARKG